MSLGPCSDPIEALVNDRKITPDPCGWLTRMVHEDRKLSRVIIGWDNRPITSLVQALGNALNDGDIEVISVFVNACSSWSIFAQSMSFWLYGHY